MADRYQLGSDGDWLKHSNEELGRVLRRRTRQLRRWRLVCLVLMAALGWVVYRFMQTQPLEALWRF